MKAVKINLMQKSKIEYLIDLCRMSILTAVTEDDIKRAISPIHTIVLAVSYTIFEIVFLLEKIW